MKAIDELDGLNLEIVVPSHKQSGDGYELEKTRNFTCQMAYLYLRPG